ncbi:MAG: 4Fe-4S dicluster domain-containing protein [Rhizobiaceae bacterium]|nr:MAG: 4Fe-4S dicluster domain-containing protein [Rhizobiaceae bacterium]CAG0975425.1 formate dehydrogenase (NADP+) beta subunit [Rhizobiaceae bacterium]
MLPTDAGDPSHFRKVVDCQWACPAQTPVPEYIRLIAHGRHSDAYMVNWQSNVFPGILGRTCDRPCEPACRRGRVEDETLTGRRKEPVAICRLKRVAADNKEDITSRLPKAAFSNGRRVACVGGGPAALTVARDLAAIGYRVEIFDDSAKLGGMIRTQIPRFRLPESVIDEECGYATGVGDVVVNRARVESLKELLGRGYDAIFVGTGAPRGRALKLPGAAEGAANIHLGIDWLASVSFGHTSAIGRRVIVLGGGNTAMDCCRTARRLGGDKVTVVVRSGFEEMKASPWEKEDALAEDVEILNYMAPRSFVVEDGRLAGMTFQPVRAVYDAEGRRDLVPTGEPDRLIECDDVLVAVGQENAFPWIERDIGLEFLPSGLPKVDAATLRSTLPRVFFGGDSAFGPKNIIWAVAHGHEAAVSIDRFCNGEDVSDRPPPGITVVSQKMGIHEWSYDNDITIDPRTKVPHLGKAAAIGDIRAEVELGYDITLALKEARRCLNCDVQTVFSAGQCIECDACADVCPMDCITFTENGEEDELRARLTAPALNPEQDLYVSPNLRTGRIMVKDEDVCLHCGLCAERCPTGAWDMQKYLVEMSHAGCRS